MKLVIAGGSSPNTAAFFAALRSSTWTPETVCLLGRSEAALARMAAFGTTILERDRPGVRIETATDAGAACEGADVVLSMLRVAGLDRLQQHLRNLAGSGVTGHAASFVEAIDHLPPVLELARTVERVAPSALLAIFTNPVSLLNEAVARATGVRAVGLCHHAFSMRPDFARLLRVDPGSVTIRYQGLNHLGWVTDVRVDGAGRMHDLVEVLRREKVGKYNYWYATPELVPVDHAFCFYRRGEVWMNRQKGVRGSVADATLLLGRTAPYVRDDRRKRESLERAVEARDVSALPEFAEAAPWYSACIVPFLAAVSAPEPSELLLTWEHGDAAPSLPGVTGETAVLVANGSVSAAPDGPSLPAFASELLRQARASELLFVEAVAEGSAARATEAWLVHPNVASKKHAERLAARYFEGRGSTVV